MNSRRSGIAGVWAVAVLGGWMSVCQGAAGEWPSVVTWQPDERAVKSGLYIAPKAPAKREKVAFIVTEPAGVSRKSWPVRGSIPLFRGELSDPKRIRLLDGSGVEIPVQGMATAYWPEKTIRFLCLDFLTDIDPGQTQKFTLEYGSDVRPASGGPLTAEVPVLGKAVRVGTGATTFAFQAGTPFLTVALQKPSRTIGGISGRAVICANEKGASPASLDLIIDEVDLVEKGPVQATVHLTGHYGPARSDPRTQHNEETWRYPASLFFRMYAGTGQAYVEHNFGYNGNEYREFVQSYGLVIPTGLGKGRFRYGPETGKSAEASLGVRLNQFAHDRWELTGKEQAKGKRISGWAAVEGDGACILAAVREAWQNWPVAFAAEENGNLLVEILGEKPDRALDLRYEPEDAEKTGRLELTKTHSKYSGEELSNYYGEGHGRARGLMKIHELTLDFSPTPGEETAARGDAFHSPLVPWPGPRRFAETKVAGHIEVYDDPAWEPFRDYYSGLFDVFPLIHEANGLYGWVDWGDIPASSGVAGGKFNLHMEGGVGWSNGERAVAALAYHYIAGGGRRFLDNLRAFVHHTIGIDTEHAGGDSWRGLSLRHDQVHWRQKGGARQGGFRGWSLHYSLTGDPEVGRLILLEGADAPANRISMNLLPETADPTVGYDYQHTAVHCIAHMNWITTGDWRYARAHHAICRVWEECGKAKKPSRQGWVFFTVKDGEPVGYELKGDGPLKDYWYTYFGDDLCLEWASLTGDPAAVDALLLQAAFYTRDEPVATGLYHSPEALLAGLAHLAPAHPHLAGVLRYRMWAHAGMRPFVSRRPAVSGRYASAEDWARLGDGMGIFGSQGKNGLSIHGAEAMEILFWMHAWRRLGNAAPAAP